MSKQRRFPVSNEEFVKGWQKATTRTDVCRLLGLTPAQVNNRACILRAMGVKLKKFPSGPKGSAQVPDVAALNAIITKGAK